MNSSRSFCFLSPLMPVIKTRSQSTLRRKIIHACTTSQPTEKLLQAARQRLSQEGLHVNSVDWNSHVLTVIVQRENGQAVTANDCADASALLGPVIEEGKFLDDAVYTLQVSTPGTADRLTKQHEFDAFEGFPVSVRTANPVKGKTLFWGTLGKCTNETVQIAAKGRIIKLKRQDVADITLCTAQQVKEGLSR